MSSATNLPYETHSILMGTFALFGPSLFRFPFLRRKKTGVFPRDSIDPRKTVDSQPQYVVVRKMHTPSNGLLDLSKINSVYNNKANIF